MNFQSVLFTLFLLVNVISANVLKSWYSSLGSSYTKSKETAVDKHEEKKGRLVLETGLEVSTIPPVPEYKPKPEKIMKKEKDETCELQFDEHDILMLTLIQRNSNYSTKPVKPIIMNPKSIQLQLKSEPEVDLKSSLAKFLKLSKLTDEDIPIRLHMKSEVIKELPKLNADDIFVLTIITSEDDGSLQIKSHFVESISTDK